MRTTIDIDDDLLMQIRQKALEAGLPLKTMVNRALRRGISATERPKRAAPYKCKSFSLGFPPQYNIDHSLELAEKLEDEEIARKLLLRK